MSVLSNSGEILSYHPTLIIKKTFTNFLQIPLDHLLVKDKLIPFVSTSYGETKNRTYYCVDSHPAPLVIIEVHHQTKEGSKWGSFPPNFYYVSFNHLNQEIEDFPSVPQVWGTKYQDQEAYKLYLKLYRDRYVFTIPKLLEKAKEARLKKWKEKYHEDYDKFIDNFF